MAIQGEHSLNGIQLENSYVHITRIGCTKQYSEINDTWAKYYVIDYDFGVFKNQEQFQLEPNEPIKKYFRVRFQTQILDDTSTDIWELAYSNLKNQLVFRDFTNI